MFQAVTVTANSSGGSETKTGNLLIPPANQSFNYDADGNMTDDSVWSYIWDAENRLTEVRPLTNNPPASKLWLTFKYDAGGRRIEKSVRTWNTGTSGWNVPVAQCFVYDGPNVIGRFNSTAKTFVQGYVWGADLGGSTKSAGGVGGLIAIRDATNGTHFVTHDGDGNVVGLINAADGKVSAQYEYDPFGKPIRESGAMAAANPFRFSTKWRDTETGLYYYGYRYYNPDIGQWQTRDLIEEAGGINVYGFVMNNPNSFIDPYGLSWFSEDEYSGPQHMAPDGNLCDKAPNSRKTRPEPGDEDWEPPITGLGVDDNFNGKTGGQVVRKMGKESAWAIAGMAIPAERLAGFVGKALKKIPSPFKKGAKAGAELTGQIHHGISRRVHAALEQHPNLKGLYQARDPRFVTQAKDAASHTGYQHWHRNLDAEVSDWIRNNPNATPQQFENYLRTRYSQPDLQNRFPNGL